MRFVSDRAAVNSSSGTSSMDTAAIPPELAAAVEDIPPELAAAAEALVTGTNSKIL